MTVANHESEESSGSSKIQKIGGSSYYIVMPKKWVKENKIDLQHVDKEPLEYAITNDGKLILFPKIFSKINETKEIPVGPHNLGTETILRQIISAYLWGYKKIYVHSEERLTDELKNRIKKVIVQRRNLGCILVFSEKAAEIATGVNYISEPVMSCLEKMVRQALFIYDEATDILAKKRELPGEDYLWSLDEMVDGLYLYNVRSIKLCSDDERLMQRLSLTGHRQALGARLVSRYVERIADHGRDLGEGAIRFVRSCMIVPPDIERQLLMINKSARLSFENATKAFLTENYAEAEKEIERIDNAFIIDEKPIKIEDVEKNLTKEIKENKNLEKSVSCELMSIVHNTLRIARNSKGIAQIALNVYYAQFQNGRTRIIEEIDKPERNENDH